MRVAVAADDSTSISQHFGRSASWLIYDVEGDRITMTEKRANSHKHHNQQGCHSGSGHHHGPHSHRGLIESLADCKAVITAGIGWRAAEDLKQHGIQPFAVSLPCTPEEAVTKYAAGGLEAADQVYCRGQADLEQ
ncbi:MAG: iron-molybdenum cofactor biosynthesis protein [bacterium]|nr:iron-molybdenum cofactor biosynthesis protein [bacterium]